MSDLHLIAQEIVEDLNKHPDLNMAGIINYHTQSCTEAEKSLIIDAVSELLKEQLLGEF